MPASGASGPVSSFWMTVWTIPLTANSAFEAAVGSVASASISSEGRSWRKKLAGESRGDVDDEQHFALSQAPRVRRPRWATRRRT